MSIFLILFLVSLLGIVFLVGKKVIALKGVQQEDMVMESTFQIPDLEEIGQITHKKVRKYSYVALVATLRLYLRTSNMAKRTSTEFYNKVKDRLSRERLTADSLQGREVSKFLKLISDYKQKINKLKHKIKEEEEL